MWPLTFTVISLILTHTQRTEEAKLAVQDPLQHWGKYQQWIHIAGKSTTASVALGALDTT